MKRRQTWLAVTAIVVMGIVLSACGSATLVGSRTPHATGSEQGSGHRSHATTTDPTTTTTSTTPPPALTTTSTAAPAPTTTTSSAPVTSTTVAPAPTPTTAAAPVAPSTAPDGCPATLANELADAGGGSQLVTVEAATYTTTYATFTAWARQGSCWVAVYGPWTARIGEHGFSDHHTEGVPTTPTGIYGFESTMYGNAPNPGVQYAYQTLTCGDWWDETSNSPAYNTFVVLGCATTPPFGGGSEALWTETSAYPSFAVIEYNTGPIVPGAGSAIFLHADTGSPTAGCVSLPLGELDEVLDWLAPSDGPLIAMGPSSEISNF